MILKESIGTPAGKVLDCYGNPVSDVEVVASNYDNRYTATIDESGKFRIEKVIAGGCTVTASSTGYMDSIGESTSIVLGETTEITLKLLTPIAVKNHSFEEGLDGWEIVISEPEGVVFSQDRREFNDDAPDGYYALSFWADVDYETEINQAIKDILNGDYILYAWIYNGGEQNDNYIYAKDSSNTEKLDLPASPGWRRIEMPFTVNEGEITIGFYNDSNKGNWMVVDKIEIGLIKVNDSDQDLGEEPGEDPHEDLGEDPSKDPDKDPDKDPSEDTDKDPDDKSPKNRG